VNARTLWWLVSGALVALACASDEGWTLLFDGERA
jgi:hypothetical protein